MGKIADVIDELDALRKSGRVKTLFYMWVRDDGEVYYGAAGTGPEPERPTTELLEAMAKVLSGDAKRG